jgi:hypothetical protein
MKLMLGEKSWVGAELNWRGLVVYGFFVLLRVFGDTN